MGFCLECEPALSGANRITGAFPTSVPSRWLGRAIRLNEVSLALTLFAVPSTGAPPVSAAEQVGASRNSQPHLIVQTGHTSAVTHLAWSPNGHLLASGGGDDVVRLWDSRTGLTLRELRGHGYYITGLAWRPDGRVLASAAWDNTIRLWDPATGSELRQISHPALVNAVCWSPDGKTLVSGCVDGVVRLWNPGTGRIQGEFRGHTDRITCLDWSPDGKVLASGSQDHTIRLWNPSVRQQSRLIRGHTDRVTTIAWKPDGRWLASGGLDGLIYLWNRQGQVVRTLRGNAPHTGGRLMQRATQVAWSPNGAVLACGSPDFAKVRLWDVRSGRVQIVDTNDFPSGSSEDGALAWRPDGKVVTFAVVKEIGFCDPAIGKMVGKLASYVEPLISVAWSPDGSTIASASSGRVSLWDTQSGQLRHTLHAAAETLTWSPDGKRIAVAGYDGKIRLWDATLGELRLVIEESPAQALAWSPDGRVLAAAGNGGIVYLWDAETGTKLRELTEGHTEGFSALAWRPDGGTLACLTEDGVVYLWNGRSFRFERRFSTGGTEGYRVAWRPDGKSLAVAFREEPAQGMIGFWDTSTWEQIKKIRAHFGWISSLTWSANGETIASSGIDKGFRLWNVATEQLSSTLEGHSVYVIDVSHRPDGAALASVSYDGTLRVWPLGGSLTGKSVAMVAFEDGSWAAVDSDGRYDASNGGDIEGLHWVIKDEPIELRQFKEGYYDPELLAKHLGYRKEPLRSIPALTSLRLYPEVTANPPAPGSMKLKVHLRNRGGGIGPVEVYVNGKLAVTDARPKGFNSSQDSSTLTVSLPKAPAALGQENDVRIYARTAAGDLQSRGVGIHWTAPGHADTQPPHLYAVVAGISTYAAPGLRLHFAAKDAEDFARALSLAGERLFPGRVHVRLLSSEIRKPGSPLVGVAPLQPATKEAFRRAFSEIIRSARPNDIVVIYCSGHGLAFQREGKSGYAYLTQDARTADVASTVFLRDEAVTGDDLALWTRLSKARHQVLILDTCAAGAAITQFSDAQRASADQIRAVERVKDTAGLHVLMGSAADRVSYEASQYGQGLLTYSLLQGMRGAALDGGGVVEVTRLFDWAERTVPNLAQEIQLPMQAPLVSQPKGQGFPIGQLTEEDRQAIHLQEKRPFLLPPRFSIGSLRRKMSR
jgi:WD40 repeat protein